MVRFGWTVCWSTKWFKTSFLTNKQLDQTQPTKFVPQFVPLPQFSEYHTTSNTSTTSLSGSNGNICSSSLCNISLKTKAMIGQLRRLVYKRFSEWLTDWQTVWLTAWILCIDLFSGGIPAARPWRIYWLHNRLDDTDQYQNIILEAIFKNPHTYTSCIGCLVFT